VSVSSRERLLPGWAALGPRAHPRWQARWPVRAVHAGRQAPPRPRTVVAHPARTAATRQVRQRRAAARSPALAQPPPTGDPRAGLASLVSGRVRPPPRSEHTRPGPRPTFPGGLRTTSAASPASSPPRAVDQAARGRGRLHRTRPVPVVKVALPHRRGPNATAGLTCGETVGTGQDRTDSQADTRQLDGPIPDEEPDDRALEGLDTGRTGQQTAGPPDGRIPDDGTGRVDTAWWTPTGDRQHGRHPGIAGQCDDARPLDAGWKLRRADATLGRSATRTAQQTGHYPGRAWPLP
jgi:hypothetical protein